MDTSRMRALHRATVSIQSHGLEVARNGWMRCLHCLTPTDPKPDCVVVSGGIPPGVPDAFYAKPALFAREIDAGMVPGAAGEPFLRDVREGVFLVIPSLREFRMPAGKRFEDKSRQAAAAENRC